MNGKGSSPRPVDGEKYRRNYDEIFRKKSLFRRLDDPVPISRNVEWVWGLMAERDRLQAEKESAPVPGPNDTCVCSMVWNWPKSGLDD